MLESYIAYRGEQILYCCKVTAEHASYIRQQGVAVISGDVDPSTFYMKNGLPFPRPRPDNTAYLDGHFLRDVPVPSLIIIGGSEYSCDEDTVELEFDQPGTYTIRVISWPYLDKEFVYENPAQ